MVDLLLTAFELHSDYHPGLLEGFYATEDFPVTVTDYFNAGWARTTNSSEKENGNLFTLTFKATEATINSVEPTESVTFFFANARPPDCLESPTNGNEQE